MEDDEGAIPGRPNARRGSGYSLNSPRPNVQRPSTSPTRTTPRIRLNTVGLPSRADLGASYNSPLAQVFQPLVVDEETDTFAPTSLTNGGLSYGPASRRRVTSIVPSRRPPDPLLGQAQMNNAMKRFPVTNSGLSPPNPAKNIDVPAKRRGRSYDRSLPERPTIVEEVAELNGRESDVASGMLAKRLDDIEERQQRIENLLNQLVNGMLVNGGTDNNAA